MALSRLAAQFAAEINQHDWSDAPWRADRAGHDRKTDSNRGNQVLDPQQTDKVRMNVMWVTGQVLAYNDPNFNIYEFAEACGVNIRTSSGQLNGGIRAGLRGPDGDLHRPGTWTSDSEGESPTF